MTLVEEFSMLQLGRRLTLEGFAVGLADEELFWPASTVGVASYQDEADPVEEAAADEEDATDVDASSPHAEDEAVGSAQAVEEEATSTGLELATAVLDGMATSALDEGAGVSATGSEPESLEAPGATQLVPVNPVASVGRLEA